MIVKKQRIVFSYILTEFLLLNFSYLLFLYLQKGSFAHWFDTPISTRNVGILFLLINLSWLSIVIYKGAMDLYEKSSLKKRVKRLCVHAIGFTGVLSFFFLVFDISFIEPSILLRPVLLFAMLNAIVFILITKRFRRKIQEKAFGSNLLILGAGKSGKEVLNFSNKNKHLGYGVLGFVVDESGSLTHQPGIHVLGKFENLGLILDREPVHELVITLPSQQEQKIKQAIDEANYRGIRISVIPEKPEYMGENFKDYRLGDLKISQLRQTPLDDFLKFFLKKVFDILFALTVIILLSPVYLIIATLIALESGFPIFYLPIRKREADLTFSCIKFRTMKVSDDPKNGTKSTVKNDPRITRIGKYLRKFDLDELPQFFNVLKGEMSVVGPRPHRLHLKQDFRNVVQEYMVRNYVKPGITGWAQVNGWRGPTVTPEQKEERIKHDLWYITNWSFFLDLKIIFLTVFGRKTRKNAF